MFQTFNFGLATYFVSKNFKCQIFINQGEMLDHSLRHGWRLCWYGTSGAPLLGIIHFGGLFKFCILKNNEVELLYGEHPIYMVVYTKKEKYKEALPQRLSLL
jgi:hypothetical protein